MHMADALVSPVPGATLWAVSGGLIIFCAQKLKRTLPDHLVPMMGVLGAFVFAAQMINFSIPGTGSSGHLGGGLLLAILLGPCAAFLVIASVLTVQAFFFADGGLLALGCNVFNLGVFPIFVAYPLIYRPLARGRHNTPRAWVAAVIAAIAGLQLGALGVVVETWASGITELPFTTFVLLMLPIHLAIGLAEGLATASVLSFLAKARPEALAASPTTGTSARLRPVLAGFAVAAVILGGILTWFASTHPDGLEWAVAKVAGGEGLSGRASDTHRALAKLQEKTAFLPDYGLKSSEAAPSPVENDAQRPEAWPGVNAGTSLSGILGGLITLVVACLAGYVIRRHAIRHASSADAACKGAG